MTDGNLRDELPVIVAKGRGRTAVRLVLSEFGRDLVLHIGGGESHAGAVAVSHHGGLGDEPATELLLTPGHKEGFLARDAAQALAEASGRTCVVVAGIHQEDASRKEITTIVANVEKAVEELTARFI